jgi:hypothetical protein
MALSPYERFITARDFLQQHRLDYDTAYRDYRAPELDEFNWALDFFDVQARGNETPALWVVEEDGSEKRSATPTWPRARARWPTGCAGRACGAATACC